MTAATESKRPRRTWPQKILIVAGLVLAMACFAAARIFWEARTVLADLPRIRVGPDVLTQPGNPGDPVNFLLVGVDSSEGLDPDDPVRSGRDVVAEANGRFLSDTILMLRLDPATGDAAVLSIPRDLYVDVPGSSHWKINSTLLIGGMDKLIETIDANLGVPVSHFVMVDFAGFSELVQLVGGVPVYFPYATRDAGSGLDVQSPGCWVLDGPESLAYVRARTLEELIDGTWTPLTDPAPDLARIERQQEFMVLALEQALELGGSDLGRIREFVEVGTQAVQLDETLTAGELLDLATAFSEYDTEALRVATLPVRPLFTSEGQYLGEELQLVEADDILSVFQGSSDSVRPEQVAVRVSSADGAQRARILDQLGERGFVTADGDQTSGRTTTVRFGPESSDEALILGRYLEVVPRFVVDDVESIHLEIGTDFAGVRSFPRSAVDVRGRVDRAASESDEQAPATTSARATTATDVPDDTSAELPTTTDSVVIGDSVDPEIDRIPPTTIERGRPPDDVGCAPTGG